MFMFRTGEQQKAYNELQAQKINNSRTGNRVFFDARKMRILRQRIIWDLKAEILRVTRVQKTDRRYNHYNVRSTLGFFGTPKQDQVTGDSHENHRCVAGASSQNMLFIDWGFFTKYLIYWLGLFYKYLIYLLGLPQKILHRCVTGASSQNILFIDWGLNRFTKYLIVFDVRRTQS